MARREFDGGQYAPCEILEIQTATERYSVWCSQMGLRSWLLRDDPQVGAEVEIKFTGRELITNRDGSPAMKKDNPTEQMERMVFSASVFSTVTPSVDFDDSDIPF